MVRLQEKGAIFVEAAIALPVFMFAMMKRLEKVS